MSRRSLTYVVIHLFARNEERSQTLILLKYKLLARLRKFQENAGQLKTVRKKNKSSALKNTLNPSRIGQTEGVGSKRGR